MHSSHTSTFKLNELTLYNWGRFNGLHTNSIQANIHGIIGPEHKLIDDFLTSLDFLFPSRASESSLLSYIRGESAKDSKKPLRDKKTLTALGGFLESVSLKINIAVFFWIDADEENNDQINKFWIIQTGNDIENKIKDWIDIWHSQDIDVLLSFDRYDKSFNCFTDEISFEKKLSSYINFNKIGFFNNGLQYYWNSQSTLNDLFYTKFSDSSKIKTSYDALNHNINHYYDVYNQLHSFIEQKKVFKQLEEAYQKHSVEMTSVQKLIELKKILPSWFANQSYGYWQKNSLNLQEKIKVYENNILELNKTIAQLEQDSYVLLSNQLDLGIEDQNVFELMHSKFTDKKENIIKKRSEYEFKLDKYELTLPKNRIAYLENKEKIIKIKKKIINDKKDEFENLLTLNSIKSKLLEETKALEEQYCLYQKFPNSNLPFQLLKVRSELAKFVGLNEEDLPFISELLQVKKGFLEKRDSIEHCLGEYRFSVLIPNEFKLLAKQWNEQNRYDSHRMSFIAINPNDSVSSDNHDYFSYLKFKEHPYINSLHLILNPIFHSNPAININDSESLSLYIYDNNGVMNVLGFENCDMLTPIKNKIDHNNKKLSQISQDYWASRNAIEEMQAHIDNALMLASIDFDEIDDEFESQLVNLIEHQLKKRSDENNLEHFYQQKNIIDNEIVKVKHQIESDKIDLAKLEKELEYSIKMQNESFKIAAKKLTATQQAFANERLPKMSDQHILNEQKTKSSLIIQIDSEIDSLNKRIVVLHEHIIQIMSDIKLKVKTQLFSEIDRSLDNIEEYMEYAKELDEVKIPTIEKEYEILFDQCFCKGIHSFIQLRELFVESLQLSFSFFNAYLQRYEYQNKCHLSIEAFDNHKYFINQFKLDYQKSLEQITLNPSIIAKHHIFSQLMRKLRNYLKSQASPEFIYTPILQFEFSYTKYRRDIESSIPSKFIKSDSSCINHSPEITYLCIAMLSYLTFDAEQALSTLVIKNFFHQSNTLVIEQAVKTLKLFDLHAITPIDHQDLSQSKQHMSQVTMIYRQEKFAACSTIHWHKLNKIASIRKSSDQKQASAWLS